MYIRLIVLEQSHDSEIWITFFLKCHFKKRKKSRFGDFRKTNKKAVLSQR